MELTKKALEDVRFHTKGKWYSAEQVDAFIEELTVSVDEVQRQAEELRGDIKGLEMQLKEARAEAARYQEELKAARLVPVPQRQEPQTKAPVIPQQKAVEELERERDDLVETIKLLRRFRETFREAVERDAKLLLEQTEALTSDELL